MEKLQINGRWSEVKAKLQNNYPELEEEDFMYEKGNEGELLDRLIEKTGKEREELVEEINQYSDASA